MPYCSQNDLEILIPVTELAELTSDSGDTPNSNVITQIIDRVGAEIDSYLSVRYIIPLLVIPDLIKGLVVDMVLYHLYSRRSSVPQIRRKNYEDAREFLQNVAMGKSNIIGLDGGEILKKSSCSNEIKNNARIFLRSEWGNY
jgi:phage gp36-like protein